MQILHINKDGGLENQIRIVNSKTRKRSIMVKPKMQNLVNMKTS